MISQSHIAEWWMTHPPSIEITVIMQSYSSFMDMMRVSRKWQQITFLKKIFWIHNIVVCVLLSNPQGFGRRTLEWSGDIDVQEKIPNVLIHETVGIFLENSKFSSFENTILSSYRLWRLTSICGMIVYYVRTTTICNKLEQLYIITEINEKEKWQTIPDSERQKQY